MGRELQLKKRSFVVVLFLDVMCLCALGIECPRSEGDGIS